MPECTIETAKEIINDFCLREFDMPADFTNTSHVDIAHTTDPITELPIQIYVNLNAYKVCSECNGKVVKEEAYSKIEDFCSALAQLAFDEVVALTDEEVAVALKD